MGGVAKGSVAAAHRDAVAERRKVVARRDFEIVAIDSGDAGVVLQDHGLAIGGDMQGLHGLALDGLAGGVMEGLGVDLVERDGGAEHHGTGGNREAKLFRLDLHWTRYPLVGARFKPEWSKLQECITGYLQRQQKSPGQSEA